MDVRPIGSFTPSAVFAAATPALGPDKAQGYSATAPAKDATDVGKAQAVAAAQQGTPGKEELAEAVKSINLALQDRSPGLEFSIDSDSQRAIVKVVDRDTQEVIRQMPSREALEIAKSLETLQGLLEKQSA